MLLIKRKLLYMKINKKCKIVLLFIVYCQIYYLYPCLFISLFLRKLILDIYDQEVNEFLNSIFWEINF